MARFRITLIFEGSRIDSVRKKVQQFFGDDAVAAVHKVITPTSRADRLFAEANSIEDAAAEIGCLRDELQEWLGNLPEKLQEGSKADELNEAISQLEDLISAIEDLDFGSVNFPGMF